jgi:hypothetical protein
MLEEAPSRLPSHDPEPESYMRSFQPPADTRYYSGVDLHARSLYVVALDADGQVRFSRNLPAAPEPILRTVQPFVLGHAWAMIAVHGCNSNRENIP